MLDSLVCILSLMEEVPPFPGTPPPEQYPMLYHPDQLRDMELGHLVVPNRELEGGMPFSWELALSVMFRGVRRMERVLYGAQTPPMDWPGVPPIL